MTPEGSTTLLALQLASILADSPTIDSASKDIFMSQIHSITSQWISSIFGWAFFFFVPIITLTLTSPPLSLKACGAPSP